VQLATSLERFGLLQDCWMGCQQQSSCRHDSCALRC
jgi:hypothetical protein